MRWLKEIPYGGLIPRGYGVAYQCPNRFCFVCCPFPFHLILGPIRCLYIRIRVAYTPDLLSSAFMAGYVSRSKQVNDAYNAGYEHAFRLIQVAKDHEGGL